MIRLKHLFKQPLSAVPTKLAVFLLVIALLGFADASYLTIEHYQGVVPPCSVVSGCETVLTSSYSVIGGVPVSLLGAVFYFVVLVGICAFLESKKTAPLKWALLCTVFGFLFSLWFIYVQARILDAWCLYCLGSAFTSTILFITACVTFNKYLVSPTYE
jgi:uncharacterized membrane protein